jgi:hypothetical protein
MSQEQRADERTRTAFPLFTSDHSGVAGVCTGLQFPHIQAAFSSPVCYVLHRIAVPVVSAGGRKALASAARVAACSCELLASDGPLAQ